ncbi:MAG: hypothetical protein A2W00_03485 [Candidatus Eisenbacteria bacterium RBG_16_71_46]|nr:MAG: hypothetical protein A2W00_03485 [Candidatus Eisenbacteria bacterium RBG_16_71_46]
MVMGSRSRIRPLLAALLATAIVLAGAPAGARADELSATGRAGGIVLHSAAETLRDYCRRDAANRLWLVLPGGARFELVTSTADPAIANPGDGAFHPFDPGEVRAALAGLRYPLDGLRADIYVLPYPRRNGLTSATGPRLILLSPGVRPLIPGHQHAEVAHEIGHIVHFEHLPDGDRTGWSAYRRLRGIEDEQVYSAASAHAFRPHEIFAEDFRALFGDALANYSGSIENSALTPPSHVPELAAFMVKLSQLAAGPSDLAAFPNPSRGSLTLARAGGATTPVDLFDLAGRRIATLEPQAGGGSVSWSWDRRDRFGRPVGPGVLLARARDGGGRVARITLLP